MKSVAVGIPLYSGKMDERLQRTLFALECELDAIGVTMDRIVIQGESLVPRARNGIVHMFLKMGADRLLFLDDDILFKPKDAVQMLLRPEDVVAAPCPLKRVHLDRVIRKAREGHPHPEWFIGDMAFIPLDQTKLTVRDGCLVEVDAAGTGMMALSRECLLKMCEAYPELAYISVQECYGEPTYALFNGSVVDMAYLSEDYSFCDLWRRLGGAVWLYLNIQTAHVGTHTFTADVRSIFQGGAT